MAAINEALGLAIVIVGLALIVFEFIHPGAILLIPGSILVVVGFFYLVYPSDLLGSEYGPIAIVVVALLAALVEVPYYRHIAPEHPPMAATAAGLVGKVGVVTVTVVPDSLRGKVRLDSEIWSARADREIPVGARVRVVNAGGVSVEVAPVSADEPAPDPPRER
ncbi:MAG: NfeD family protein [Thermoplasmata archaeon]